MSDLMSVVSVTVIRISSVRFSFWKNHLEYVSSELEFKHSVKHTVNTVTNQQSMPSDSMPVALSMLRRRSRRFRRRTGEGCAGAGHIFHLARGVSCQAAAAVFIFIARNNVNANVGQLGVRRARRVAHCRRRSFGRRRRRCGRSLSGQC